MSTDQKPNRRPKPPLPSVEKVRQKLGQAESIDDFFGKEGIFARLFADTLEQMLEAELTGQLGYGKYEAKGRKQQPQRQDQPETTDIHGGSGYRGTQRSQRRFSVEGAGERSGQFQRNRSQDPGAVRQKAIAPRYPRHPGRLVWRRHFSGDHQHHHRQSLDAGRRVAGPSAGSHVSHHLSGRHSSETAAGAENVTTACYVVLEVDLDGQGEVLGYWLGEGGEGANFWLSVVSDLQARGVEDIFIACIDGLTGFKDAIQAVFPQTQIQRCIIHQIRQSLKYIGWKDRKAFVGDLKTNYRAPTREAAESALVGDQLGRPGNQVRLSGGDSSADLHH